MIILIKLDTKVKSRSSIVLKSIGMMNGFNMFIFVFFVFLTFKSVSLQVITAPEERDGKYKLV